MQLDTENPNDTITTHVGKTLEDYAYSAVFDGQPFVFRSALGLAIGYQLHDRAIPLWLSVELSEQGYSPTQFARRVRK